MFALHNNTWKIMRFVDRTDEKARLTAAFTGQKPTLTVVYGRRRLGKSTLIKRVLGGKDVYYLADRSDGSHQRMLISRVLAWAFPDFDKVPYPDWESLLRMVNYRTREPFTLCIDELPYLVEQSPELPSVLQKLVDEHTLRYNIVVCGSSQQMMYGLFLDATAPLYGRADVILNLKPLRLPYVGEALGLDAVSAIEEYAVWGGVPRYWELREPHNSLGDALWHNVLSANGILYEEPSKLFQDDVRDIVKTATIMSYVAAGACRMSEIAARCGEPATNLSRPLKKLIDLKYLERELPWGADETNTKKSLYRIADPFMAFYFRFVVPNRSFIELGRLMPVEQEIDRHFHEYVSVWWEKLCRDAVTGNSIGGRVYGTAHRWWGSVLNEQNRPEQIEIDVVAESLDKRFLLVGECKWTTQENGTKLTAQLLRKASLLPAARTHTIVPVLFLKTTPTDDAGNTLFPADIVRFSGERIIGKR